MTKSEIENLIDIIEDYTPKHHINLKALKGKWFYDVDVLHDVLRNLAVEGEKTCGPDYKAMYERCAAELEKAKVTIEEMRFDKHRLDIEKAYYVGAVAAMETIFGRKFEPEK